MVVFTKRMQRLSPQNVPAAFASIEEHIRYMQESIEMAMRPLQELQELKKENEALQAEVASLNATITALTAD